VVEVLKKPKILPQNPPIIWANSEIVFAAKELKSSLPRYNTRMRTKVRGISPFLKFVKEAKRIIMKATPEAPNRLLENKKTLSTPVTRAVRKIISRRGQEPYRSSRIGPMRRINEKLAIRWVQLAWPITWVTKVTQFRIRKGTKLPLPGTINQDSVKEGNRVLERISTKTLIKVKVNMVGALYLIRMLLVQLLYIPGRSRLLTSSREK
jgi:hypothetical protein